MPLSVLAYSISFNEAGVEGTKQLAQTVGLEKIQKKLTTRMTYHNAELGCQMLARDSDSLDCAQRVPDYPLPLR
jgi:hypothetical protein